MPVLDDIDIGAAALFGGIDAQRDAIPGLIDGAFGAKKNLVRSFADFEAQRSGGAVAFLIGGLDLDGLGFGAGPAAKMYEIR